jgi:hypothetical protein
VVRRSDADMTHNSQNDRGSQRRSLPGGYRHLPLTAPQGQPRIATASVTVDRDVHDVLAIALTHPCWPGVAKHCSDRALPLSPSGGRPRGRSRIAISPVLA